MRALRLMAPARASVWPVIMGKTPAPQILRSSASVAALPSLSRRLPLSASRLQRPFSHIAPQRNNWRPPPRRDPREQLSEAKPLFHDDSVSKLLRSPSLHAIVALSFAGAVTFYFMNIETVPVSGRRRFNCYSEASVRATAEAQAERLEYDIVHSGGRFLSDWDPRTRMVKRVLQRLIPVSGMEDDEWEVKVIDDPHTANAFVLPGGKVFVFSGLIPIASNEHGLAAVLGHEIAHNLAEHVAERMSSQVGINILLYSLMSLTGIIFIIPTSVGHYLLDLVFSRPMGRRQEAEADYIGLMMMAEACYDPREALGFWRRMKSMQHGEEPPEWMSTHPSNDNRIEKIQQWLPKALEKLHESDCQGTANFATLFREALENRRLL